MKKYLLLFLISFSFIILISCGKDNGEEVIDDHNYAVNEVVDDNEDEEDIEETTEPTTTEEEYTEEVEEFIPKENTYNVVDDVNAQNENLSKYTISIDGKLLTFPCTYAEIKEAFGTLYTIEFDNYVEVNEEDYTDITYLGVNVKPETGSGYINFIFMSDTPTSLTNCKCKELIVSGMTKDNEKLMTIALEDNIHFGSTVDDIFNTYGKVTKEYTNKNGSFMIHYITDNEYKNEYYFYGANYGLEQIDLIFNN